VKVTGKFSYIVTEKSLTILERFSLTRFQHANTN